MNTISKKASLSKPVGAIAATQLKHPILRRDLAVLVMDSEMDVLDEVAALLRRRDVVVHLATDADEATQILDMHRDIGVLVADISLLQGDGLGLAARVLGRNDPAIELVMIAGQRGPDPRSPGLMADLGMLQEPLKLRDIAISVGRALARAAARRSLPGALSLSDLERH